MTRTLKVAAVLGVVGLSAACRHEEAYQKPKLPVRVEVLSAAAGAEGVRYAAALEPRVRVDMAFKIGGYVDEIATVGGRLIQEGDHVTKGMLLARVRQGDVDAKVAQARSQQAEAEAGLRQATEAYERAKALLAAKSITRPDYDAAKGAYESVQAKLAGARALVQEAGNAVADSGLHAPLDGIVLKRLVEVGSLVGPGTPGFVIADTSSVKAVFGVPDVTVAQVRARTALVVTLEAFPGREFAGHVSRVSPVADLKTRNFDVEVTVPNTDGALKVGMVASLQIAGDETRRAVLAVPLPAILRSPRKADGYAVVVVTGEGDSAKAEIRDVVLGDMVGNRVEIVSGLRAGERIVVSGATLVTDGAPVALVS